MNNNIYGQAYIIWTCYRYYILVRETKNEQQASDTGISESGFSTRGIVASPCYPARRVTDVSAVSL